MYELTTLNVYTAADNGAFAAEPVEKPDARFISVRLGIVSRHRKVNAFPRKAPPRGRSTVTSDGLFAGSCYRLLVNC